VAEFLADGCMDATSFHSNARNLKCPTGFILAQGQIHLTGGI
jgi:hypothetical protein